MSFPDRTTVQEAILDALNKVVELDHPVTVSHVAASAVMKLFYPAPIAEQFQHSEFYFEKNRNI